MKDSRTSGQIILDKIIAEKEAEGCKAGIQMSILTIQNNPHLSIEGLLHKLHKMLEEA